VDMARQSTAAMIGLSLERTNHVLRLVDYGLELREVEGRGRGLFAHKTYRPGESIIDTVVSLVHCEPDGPIRRLHSLPPRPPDRLGPLHPYSWHALLGVLPLPPRFCRAEQEAPAEPPSMRSLQGRPLLRQSKPLSTDLLSNVQAGHFG
jgi:hypothetical protein